MLPKRFWIALLVLAATSLACGSSFGNLPTEVQPTAIPTLPPPTAIPTLPSPTAAPTQPPTQAPSQRPVATSQAPPPIQLGDTLYTHPQGLFEFHFPKGWELNNEGDAFVVFAPKDPDAVSLLIVSAVNTGLPLDAQGFRNLVEAYEQAHSTEKLLNKDIKAQIATVSKITTCGDTQCYTESRYYQDDTAIIILDVSVPANRKPMAKQIFDALTDDLTYDSKAIADQPIYNDVWTFKSPGDFFTMDLPLAWNYTSSDTDTTYLDRVDSPDGNAFIESLIYDDGTQYSKTDAGKITLGLLRNAYASDLRVTDDKVQRDGSERLIWHSASQKVTGVTFFETRGTSLLFLTMVATDDTFDLYNHMFNRLLSTYVTP